MTDYKVYDCSFFLKLLPSVWICCRRVRRDKIK